MPRPTVAIVGASTHRRKFGNKSVRAHALAGYDVFPIHPTASSIEGHRAYATLAEVPVARLDRISIYLPPAVSLQILPQLQAKPAREVWFNPGADDPEVIRQAKALGLPVVIGCSMVDVGVHPGELD